MANKRKRNKDKRPLVVKRDPFVAMARKRNGAGKHKHRNTPRGGARNQHRDLMREVD